jgi:hypothetical protein
MNVEYVRIQKDAVLVHFKECLLFWHSPGDMGADFSKFFRGSCGLRYKFSRQTISKDIKRSRGQRVGTNNTRNEMELQCVHSPLLLLNSKNLTELTTNKSNSFTTYQK